MRTTINIEDGLLDDARKLAAESGRSLTAVIEDALRERVARARRPEARAAVELPVSRYGSGPAPGVDIDDSAALLEVMEREP